MRLRLEKHKLMTVVLIAIIARAGVLVAFPQHFAFSEPGGVIHGSAAYDEYALNLLATGVYGREAGLPDAGLPPLYSYLLAAVYGIFGRHYLAVAALHMYFFDVISIALLIDICRRLFPRRTPTRRIYRRPRRTVFRPLSLPDLPELDPK